MLTNLLHIVGQALLTPCIIILILLMAATLWQIGDLLVEYISDHRKHKENMPRLLKRVNNSSDLNEISTIVNESKMPERQKVALTTLIESKDLSKDAMMALAQQLLSLEEERYEKNTAIPDLIVKLGPMIGLLGTLIPLGPGIVALGQGDTQTLANSMGIAFDTTIAGVITAAVCMVISNIRNRWYDKEITAFETLTETVMDKLSNK